MKKEVISTIKTPVKPGAPFSPAIKIGNLLFVSGHVARDSIDAKEEMMEADVKTQTRETLDLIKRLVEAAGTTLDNVVKCTVFLKNLEDFNSMNEAYLEFFKHEPPARTTFEASNLVLGCSVEIEAIAYVP